MTDSGIHHRKKKKEAILNYRKEYCGPSILFKDLNLIYLNKFKNYIQSSFGEIIYQFSLI